ncbi:MAG TPA: sulfite exporter TauE/SafE family protein [Pirellulales bacterium]|jgi:hypothetical protein|nr:sulfite exporter TauE/SafE family protein [Pirellulales bacterium]
MFWFWLFLFGGAIGILSGLLGIGGGVLIVPGLMLMFGFSQTEAQGTSLAVLIPPIGIFAALVYYQHGFIRLPVVGYIAIGFVVGAYVGARCVPIVPPNVLRPAFGVLMLYLGFLFVFDVAGSRSAVALPAGIAALLSGLLARILGRRHTAKMILKPPGDHHEYHI